MNHTKTEIKKRFPDSMARDDLREAYAGRENQGPRGSKTSFRKSTKVRERSRPESRTKIPIR